ncbi:hypothetical protein HAX54_024973 [Datura stramonium]|uniref:Uncharacterized protein n=1 Tax=Datura stramonium TaxID=4076 RepID=A0ABS8S7F7_DATST|nr:hypothetical protein [Datura stramonium]
MVLWLAPRTSPQTSEKKSQAGAMAGTNNEEEKHHAQIKQYEKPIPEHMEAKREQTLREGGALKRMSAKLEIMAKTRDLYTCKSPS